MTGVPDVGGPAAGAVGAAGLAAAVASLFVGPRARIGVGLLAVALAVALVAVPAPDDSGWFSYGTAEPARAGPAWAAAHWVGAAVLGAAGLLGIAAGWGERSAEVPSRPPPPRRAQPSMWDALDRGEDPTS